MPTASVMLSILCPLEFGTRINSNKCACEEGIPSRSEGVTDDHISSLCQTVRHCQCVEHFLRMMCVLNMETLFSKHLVVLTLSPYLFKSKTPSAV